MEITVEKLQTRLDRLRKGLEDIKDELKATSGAIQECEYWLRELEKQPEPSEAEIV